MIAICPHCGVCLKHDYPAESSVICPACSQQFCLPASASDGDEHDDLAFTPESFEAETVELAMAIILTPEPGMTTEERWEKETPFLVEDIGRFLPIERDSCVLDYGCGIGRVAKPLIERYGCRVVGVDFSSSMRAMAPDYVRSDRFTVWSPDELDLQVRGGFQADYCICLWVIQHALDPQDVIERIARALRPSGLLYSMNQANRALPTNLGWGDDGVDSFALLREAFDEVNCHSVGAEAAPAAVVSNTKIQILRNRVR